MMKTMHLICAVCTALVFITLNCSNKQVSKEEKFSIMRKSMVENQIKGRGIHNKNVLEAFMNVPRHKFVPEAYRDYAYDDRPLPIGYQQTISQPYIVAYMTEILNPQSSQKVLEIGTGSGYQAAILSMLYKEVYTVEIIEALAEQAKKLLDEEGYKNIKVKTGDGYNGWKEYAPFDDIIVTCAPMDIPQPLVEQLAEGGKMIIPVGGYYNQVLVLLEKRNGKIVETETLPVIFVPMVRDK
jgi:protein-L-isoaspartate(D-aspartate) O-methyltransferase